MSSTTAGDVLVQTLIEWGVNVVFGIPGDGINRVIEALRKRKDEIRFIQVRHEEAAAFAACGYAKWTGKLGVCIATSGPGGIHLLNGLYDAKLDPGTSIGHHGPAVPRPHAHLHAAGCRARQIVHRRLRLQHPHHGAAHVENAVALACRTALAFRAVAHVTIPVGVQDEALSKDVRSKRNVAHHVSETMGWQPSLPKNASLRAAAEILNQARKPVILAGQGALDAGRQLAVVAERLGAPVVKALLGKGALADDSPYTTGGIGLLGTRPSQEAMEDCDALLIVGSSFPYIEYYPKPGQARVVQIDRNPQRIGLRAPVECPLVGDSAVVLDALLPLLTIREDRSFLETAQKGMQEWRELLQERGTRDDVPMKPQPMSSTSSSKMTPLSPRIREPLPPGLRAI